MNTAPISILHLSPVVRLGLALALSMSVGCKSAPDKPSLPSEEPTPSKVEASPKSKAPSRPVVVSRKTDLTTAQAKQILNAGMMYYRAKGVWPKGLSVLQREALLTPRSQLDPWGKRYVLSSVSDGDVQTGLRVCSNGPDKTPETPDDVCVQGR